MAMSEEEIRRLLGQVPIPRRILARAALTGSAGDMSRRARHDQESLPAGWQSGIGALYMTAFAARHRAPEEVAEMARALRGDVCGEVVLDVAAERPPGELAAIAVGLAGLPGESSADPGHDLAGSFLRQVVVRRLPSDLARLLADLRDQGKLRKDLTVLISAEKPAKIAQAVLHLRGAGAATGCGEVLAKVTESVSSRCLASFIISLARCGDHESVRHVIADATTWRVPRAAPPASPARPRVSEGVDRVVELVAELLDTKQHDLAEQVITSAVKAFAASAQQYQLYALVYVFAQHGLDDQAEPIMEMISASAPHKDPVELIIEYCRGQDPEPTAALLRAILKEPRPGVAEEAAYRLAVGLPQALPSILLTVAAWRHENLSKFEQPLRIHSLKWAEKFRDDVAAVAANRNDVTDIAALVIWLLTDADLDCGKARANLVVKEIVRRRDPGLLVTLICQLHGHQLRPQDRHKGWWTLREDAAREIAVNYNVADMTNLVKEGKHRCLVTLLWLTPDWLIHGQRRDQEVIALFCALRAANPNPSELLDLVEFSGSRFTRLVDQTSPVAALRKAGLNDEAGAWAKGKNSVWPFRPKRPEPDPPPR